MLLILSSHPKLLPLIHQSSVFSIPCFHTPPSHLHLFTFFFLFFFLCFLLCLFLLFFLGRIIGGGGGGSKTEPEPPVGSLRLEISTAGTHTHRRQHEPPVFPARPHLHAAGPSDRAQRRRQHHIPRTPPRPPPLLHSLTPITNRRRRRDHHHLVDVDCTMFVGSGLAPQALRAHLQALLAERRRRTLHRRRHVHCLVVFVIAF
ncbi:hypothetical protein LINGRAPRIM_LOCUS3283 [Linum grandiflorum]